MDERQQQIQSRMDLLKAKQVSMSCATGCECVSTMYNHEGIRLSIHDGDVVVDVSFRRSPFSSERRYFKRWR